MKYSIEYKNGKFIESLTVNNNTVTKIWQRNSAGTISGLYYDGKDFAEQLEEVEDEEVLDRINEIFDESFLVCDIEDLIKDCGVE